MRTPFPASVVASVKSFFSGSVLDVAWKAIVLAFVAVIVYALAMAGFIGAIIASIFVGSLLSDDVRAFINDLWHRDFYET